MMAIFNSIVQIFGLLGVFRYIMDQATVNALHQMLAILHKTSKTGGYLPEADRQKLLIDVGTKVWDNVVGKHEAEASGIFGGLRWIYRKFIPEGARDCINYGSIPVSTGYSWITGNNKANKNTLREKTRQITLRGMWSFLIPACLDMLSAYFLVREVEYIQVASEHDYGDDVPEHSERIVKRIMIGGGSLSFSIPHNLAFLVTAQLIVGISVFHLVSSLILILAHHRGNTTWHLHTPLQVWDSNLLVESLTPTNWLLPRT